MIASRNNDGFTLIEVMFSVAIIGIVMTSIFVLQSSMYRSIMAWSRRVERFSAGTLYMAQTRIDKTSEPTIDQIKKLDRPSTEMHYQMMPIPKESALQQVQHLYLERVTLLWQEGKEKRHDSIIMFHYRPEVKKT